MNHPIPRRGALAGAAAAASGLVLPRFAVAQADQRPAVTIAVRKIANSNTLEVLRDQSNVGERVFFSSLWEGLIGRNWQGDLEPVPLLATEWRRVDDRTVVPAMAVRRRSETASITATTARISNTMNATDRHSSVRIISARCRPMPPAPTMPMMVEERVLDSNM